ncbi:hypothetical protein G9A89_006854 [Geosiphon pyriformis]|nr:hypothetical protein G9A89_006854 [Geosiphon pyriformis]
MIDYPKPTQCLTGPLRNSNSAKIANTRESQQRVAISNPAMSGQQHCLLNSRRKKTNQLLWANVDYNKLPPILSWDNNNNGKGKQKAEFTWKTDNLTWTDNDKLTSNWKWEENKESNKEKGKEKEEKTTLTDTTTYNSHIYPSPPTNYHQPKLICVDCGKKLLSIGTCCGDDEKYSMATRFYCRACVIEHFG